LVANYDVDTRSYIAFSELFSWCNVSVKMLILRRQLFMGIERQTRFD